jgi:predicted enzyme related to lactoylglutathione lyase
MKREGAMWQHGHFYWNELMTRDPEGAKAFYGDTLGWRFDGMPMEDGTYWVCKDGDTPVGGIMPMNRPEFEGIPPHWFAYIAVDDVDARVAKATATGGKLLRPLFDVPGIGRIAIVQDPTGAAIGWITPVQRQ